MNAKTNTTPNHSFTEKDRFALQNYCRLAETIADLVGSHCEVIVHSLENMDNSVVKIVNGHLTGREVGAPMTDLGLKMLQKYQSTGELKSDHYFTRNSDGALLKSTTCMLTNEANKAVGMFCINLNMSLPFSDIIQTFMPTGLAAAENFGTNASETIEQALQAACTEVDSDSATNSKSRKKAIVKILFDNGLFEFKEATGITASHLAITRHAVYKYIREFKLQASPSNQR